MVKILPANAGDSDLIPRLGRSLGEGNGTPLQYSCLGSAMDRETWRATVHGVTKELDRTEQINNNNKWLMMLSIFSRAYWLYVYLL